MYVHPPHHYRLSKRHSAPPASVVYLQTLLEEIIVKERSRARFTAGTDRGLPTEAAPPQHEARNLGQLGTADADAVEISKRALFSAEELEAKAQAAMKRREESRASPIASSACSRRKRRPLTRHWWGSE